ncbi:rhomboid family-domain-containing protein [Circinella umbellata]|nr:rhomboid family-domain-containing protein [Circinella umbellata]
MRLGSGGNLIQTNDNDNDKKWATIRDILMGPTDRPWFIWLSAITMIVIMVFEIAKHHDVLGSMIQTDPLNPMIGPTFTVLINSGARYTPCMRSLPDYEVTTVINNCYSNNDTCTLEQLCGGGSNQGYRFFSPIFIHAGIIHVIINLLIQFQVGSNIERDLGFLRFGFLYLVSGTCGFALSSLLSPAERASMGCSGALMGLVGYLLVDTFINWKSIRGRTRRLLSLLISVILTFLFGIFPGFDNFAHLGGLLTGVVIGVLLILPVASTSQWITWGIRVVALTLLVVVFVIMLYIFYSAEDPTKICPNCKYFSCVPVSNWCDI